MWSGDDLLFHAGNTAGRAAYVTNAVIGALSASSRGRHLRNLGPDRRAVLARNLAAWSGPAQRLSPDSFRTTMLGPRAWAPAARDLQVAAIATAKARNHHQLGYAARALASGMEREGADRFPAVLAGATAATAEAAGAVSTLAAEIGAALRSGPLAAAMMFGTILAPKPVADATLRGNPGWIAGPTALHQEGGGTEGDADRKDPTPHPLPPLPENPDDLTRKPR